MERTAIVDSLRNRIQASHRLDIAVDVGTVQSLTYVLIHVKTSQSNEDLGQISFLGIEVVDSNAGQCIFHAVLKILQRLEVCPLKIKTVSIDWTNYMSSKRNGFRGFFLDYFRSEYGHSPLFYRCLRHHIQNDIYHINWFLPMLEIMSDFMNFLNADDISVKKFMKIHPENK